jgi:hypothetical protein
MHGLGYSIKQYFVISRKEWTQMFWTSFAFAFILTFRKWGSGNTFDLETGILNLILALILTFAALLAHVALQKIVAIRLGYTATYSYWVNGLLLSVFLAFMTAGYSGYIGFIIPGSVMLEHVPKIRLGKFRYGTNLKDIARVGLAGPVAHIVLVMIIGIFYFWTKSDTLFSFIYINLFLAMYSMLPIPKIDVPSKMDGGTDGLGIFYFSRTLYVLIAITVLVFAGLVLSAINHVGLLWLFIIAFVIGCIFSTIYSIGVEQKN